jgi:molybdopterin-guanine dinucleotide biosynthesis protein A/ferredoxin
MSARLLLRQRGPIELQEGETILSALARNGVHMLYSCEMGQCQACILRSDGRIPLEAQAGLSRELREGGAFLACQWIPQEDVRVFLPGEKPAVAALVLAGGRSSRMGTPKEDVRLADGRCMLDHVLDALRPLGIPVRLSISVEATTRQLATEVELLPDAVAYEGPLAAVSHALERCTEDGLLVVCCDQPLLRTDLLERLLPLNPTRRPAFFQPDSGGTILPFPGYFPRSLLHSMQEALAAGERSPRRWAQDHSCLCIRATPEEEFSLRSFNSKTELHEAGLLPNGGL